MLSLNPNNVFLTSACVAFWKYEDIEDIVKKLHSHFKENFMLEIQYHKPDAKIKIKNNDINNMKELNEYIINLARKNNIDIIMGCDSHYIYPEQKEERKAVLEAKNIKYDNEDEWFMDYPDGQTAFNRLKEQGVLTDIEIKRAMKNTNIFLKFDDIEFNDDIKLPTLYPNLTQKQKDKKYMKILADNWDKFKKDLNKDEYKKYINEFKPEVRTVIDTGMSDYFLLDYEIVKEALKMGGVITNTGRGSGVSFFTNTLLGFSKIDRISAKVHLYPERFMSKTRILQTRSLPDLDINCGNPDIFAKAQEKLLGKGHAYPMIAFGTFKDKSAFKMYARAKDIPFDVANEISKQIEKYEKDLKYAGEDEKDLINVYDYVDKKYHDLLKQSEKYKGIISDKKGHPCAYLIYQGNIKEEIGLIKCKSESTKKEVITTVIDGSIAEKYKFLKNDLLKVDVVMFIDKIYRRAGIKPHTVRELERITKNDKKTWDIYAKGLTLGVNQVEKESTTKKVMKYKPRNITELTAFVAAIRPSFKSMYSIFESRKPFEYGIKSFDKVIQTDEMKDSFLLYQEQIMATLNYAGIPMDECYGIIKGIAKKKKHIVLDAKDRFLKGFNKILIKEEKISNEEAEKMSNKVWKIIEDSAGYGFNASHAYSYGFDSLYCAYLKAHYPLEFYEVLLEEYSKKGNKDKVALLKKEMYKGFNIGIGDIKFGLDNRGFKLNKESNKINQSILSLKNLNYKISEELYNLSQNNKYNDFIELMVDIKEKTSVDNGKLNILIKIDYFSNFAGGHKILKFVELFNYFYSKKQISIKKRDEYKIKHEDIIQFSRLSDSGKTYMDFNDIKFLKYMWDNISDNGFNIIEKIKNQHEYLGFIETTDKSIPLDFAIVSDINTNRWGTTFLTLYRPNNGETEQVKIYKKTFAENQLEQFDMIKTVSVKIKHKKRKVDGKWIQLDETEKILSRYSKVVF